MYICVCVCVCVVCVCILYSSGLPWWLSGKDSACNAGNAGDSSSVPASGRFPGGGHGNPFQDSCLENPMDRGAWHTTGHRVEKSLTRLSVFTFTFHFYSLEKEMATHSSILA